MNIWKINKDTGLPFAPAGYVWKLWFEPTTRNPYMLHLKLRDTDEHWCYAEERHAIVYSAFLRGATGSTIRPRHLRKTAREILKAHTKLERARSENENGNSRIQPGEYPPNRI